MCSARLNPFAVVSSNHPAWRTWSKHHSSPARKLPKRSPGKCWELCMTCICSKWFDQENVRLVNSRKGICTWLLQIWPIRWRVVGKENESAYCCISSLPGYRITCILTQASFSNRNLETILGRICSRQRAWKGMREDWMVNWASSYGAWKQFDASCVWRKSEQMLWLHFCLKQCEGPMVSPSLF